MMEDESPAVSSTDCNGEALLSKNDAAWTLKSGKDGAAASCCYNKSDRISSRLGLKYL